MQINRTIVKKGLAVFVMYIKSKLSIIQKNELSQWLRTSVIPLYKELNTLFTYPYTVHLFTAKSQPFLQILPYCSHVVMKNSYIPTKVFSIYNASVQVKKMSKLQTF